MSNTLEITLSFKPIMDGLNRFTAGINQRLQQVQAFSQKISSGEAAIQRALGQVSAVLGAAALAKYAKEAREADKVQQQLVRTLERTGETHMLEALNAQSAALQKLTYSSDESVTTVQRLLISFGLTGQQALAMTETVLDLAQETGQSAESAAMLVGRTLRGETDELGRLNIKLDQSKGKVEAIGEALKKFAGGAARGAVADKTGRDVEARYADATENLGRAANRIAIPFLEALIPLLERLANSATALAEKLAPIAPMLGDMAAAVLPAVVGIGLLSGGITALKMVINPLRVAFAALSGQSLVALSDSLAKSAGGVSGLWNAMKNGKGVLTGLGSALAIAGGLLTSFFAGFSLGQIIGEIEAGGVKLKNWVSGTLLQMVANAVPVWGKIKEFFSAVSSGLAAFYFTLELGAKAALNPLGVKKAWADYKLQMESLAAQAAKELADIKADTEAKVKEFSGMAVDVVNEGRPKAGGNPGTAPAPAPAPSRPDLNGEHFGALGSQLKEREQREELERKRALFDLDTAIMEAEADGNQKLLASLKRERDELALLNDLGTEAYDLIQARLDLEEELEKKKNADALKEQQFSQALSDIAIKRAGIEADKYKTDEEKKPLLLTLLKDESNELEKQVEYWENKKRLSSPSDQLQIGDKLDTLHGKQAENTRAQAAVAPMGIGESILASVTAAQTAIGGFAEQIALSFRTVGESIRTSLGGALSDMVLRASSFKDAMLGMGQTIATSFVNTTAQMVADWIYSHVIMAGVRSAFHALGIGEKVAATTTEVGIHTAGEAAKTGATAGGAVARGAIRLGETIFHGAQLVFRTVAFIAAETIMTGAALAGFALRLPKIILETGAYVANAAAKAMSALASIPYIGPFLAIGAMVATVGKALHELRTG